MRFITFPTSPPSPAAAYFGLALSCLLGTSAAYSMSDGASQDGSQSPNALGPPTAPGTAELAEARAASLVEDEKAASIVRDLVALGPRMGGTVSGEAAAGYLTEAFQAMGLKTQRHLAPLKWCHEETDWSVTVRVDGAPVRSIERAWPLGYSPAGKGEAIELTLEPETGKALLSSTFRATPRGDDPCALVLHDGSNTLDGEWPLCRPHGRRQRARVAVFGIPTPEGERLRAELAAGHKVTLDWHLETTIKEARPVSVVATLPAKGTEPTKAPSEDSADPSDKAPNDGAAIARPHLLICAHGDSDSGGPGANDNGSGVAIVLEMARAWTEAIKDGVLPQPPIEVRFVIWGSEIHSTKAYRDSDLGRGVLAVLNFDQAGYGTTGERLHVEPDDIEGNGPFVSIATDVLRQYAGKPGFPKQWATNKSLGGTDSYVFSGWKRFREGKLPSVTLFTSAWGQPDEQPRTKGMPGESWRDRESVEMDYDVHYHSSGDTPENTTDLEPHNMGWCARVGLVTSLRYLARLTGPTPDVK